MKIALISDIHDHVWNLRRFLTWQVPQSLDAVLCCGDLCSPFVLALIQQSCHCPIHLVFGNNDGDTFRMTRLAGAQVQLHGELAEIDWPGCRVAMNHYPEIAERLAQSGHYDLVCYGHDHQLSLRTYGKTLLANPGTLMGYLPGKAADTLPTFVIYDTETASATVYAIELPEGEVVQYSGPYFPQS
jgi:uncharacterized protein